MKRKRQRIGALFLLPSFVIFVFSQPVLASTTSGDHSHKHQHQEQQPPCVFEYRSTLTPQGEVYSPNYPNAYPNNLNCRYEFYGRENERVILEILDFQLEPPQSSSAQEINFLDFVETVTRRNDAAQQRSTAADEAAALTTAAEDSSTSNRQCFYDFLDVFTTDGQGRLYWRSRHCGTNIEPKIVSVSPTLILVFQTDRMLNFRGFKLHFHFSYLNILPLVTEESACGASEITGEGGHLSSPNYPQPFPANLECAWTITVEKHKKIVIKFVEINFPQVCSISHVDIWDGYVADVTKPDLTVCEKLSYYHKGIKQYNSKTNRIVIRFVGNKQPQKSKQEMAAVANSDVDYFDLPSSNNNNKKKNKTSKVTTSSVQQQPPRVGFQLTWTAVYLEEKCPEFQCKGGEYCIDSKNFLCQETYKYCISNSLVCDGYLHCDTGDDSDEKHCELSFIQSRVYLSLAVVASVVFLVLTGVCVVAHRINSSRQRMHLLKLGQEASATAAGDMSMASEDSSSSMYKPVVAMQMPRPTFVDLSSNPAKGATTTTTTTTTLAGYQKALHSYHHESSPFKISDYYSHVDKEATDKKLLPNEDDEQKSYATSSEQQSTTPIDGKHVTSSSSSSTNSSSLSYVPHHHHHQQQHHHNKTEQTASLDTMGLRRNSYTRAIFSDV